MDLYNREVLGYSVSQNIDSELVKRALGNAIGCPYDNACSESFFATAKKECIYLKNYATMEEVKRDIFEYVEIFYNRKRMHSYLDYMSPVEYRLAHSA